MAVYSDMHGLRDSPMVPVWDVQAVKHAGQWVIAVADQEGNPLRKDVAIRVGARQEQQQFKAAFQEAWSTWGGRLPHYDENGEVDPDPIPPLPSDAKPVKAYWEQDHIEVEIEPLDAHIITALEDKDERNSARRSTGQRLRNQSWPQGRSSASAAAAPSSPLPQPLT
eukprot:1235655-Alexandrium_andersonii.AAC.1